MDEDGAVRLHLPITTSSLSKLDIALSEGQRIWITDGEIEEFAITEYRNGIWVAIPEENSLKDVDKNARYHI